MPAPRALRPFVHREYRVLIAALAISIFGSGMWAVAMVYQVIHLGGGPLELSLVATAGSVGLVAFVLAGGIAADRVPQRLLIIAVEGTNLAVIAAISGLALAGWLQLWHLAVGAFVLGVGAAFFFPAYSAILPRILPAEDRLRAGERKSRRFRHRILQASLKLLPTRAPPPSWSSLCAPCQPPVSLT